jgi:MFS family permease
VKLIKNLTSRTFRSLKVRNYRIYSLAQFISISGMWMQLVAQGWLVLKLTDSGLALGITAALQFLPLLVVGAWGGLLADRFDKRKGLIATQTSAAFLALILGFLTATGNVELWMVYALSLLLGFVNVIDMPMRQAFVVEMVGPRDLPNAVALNGASFTAARMVGPAAAGILIQVAGIAPSFFINAVTYLAVIGGLLAMRRSELMRSVPLVRARGQLRDGFRYVWRTHDLRFTLLMIALVATFAFNFQVLLPVLAKHEFGGDAGTYGLMGSVMGFGAVVGALFAAAQHRPRRRMLLGASLGSGVFLIATAASPTLPLALICLWFVGAANIIFIATANATLQVTCDDNMRGRVMALYAIVFLGGTPIGGPIIGWVAEQFGGRAGVLVGGVVALLAVALGAGIRERARRRTSELRLEPEATPELVVIDREREIAGR